MNFPESKASFGCFTIKERAVTKKKKAGYYPAFFMDEALVCREPFLICV